MKLTVIYGDDVVRGRERMIVIIEKIKSRDWEIVRLNKKGGEVIGELTSGGLFGEQRLYVLEDINLLAANDFKWLADRFDLLEINLLVWQKGNLPVSVKKQLPKETRYEKYEVPRVIFGWLGTVWPGNGDKCLRLLHEITDPSSLSAPKGQGNSEFILAMLARQLRDLMIIKLDEDALSYPGWRKGKLKQQADKFEERELKELIKKLAKADVEAKTGGVDLVTSLDLIVSRELE